MVVTVLLFYLIYIEGCVAMKPKYLVWLGTIVGVTIGYIGIPVVVPNTSAHWVWTTPFGYRAASVFVFGTLGYLVGSCVKACILKNATLIWSYGITSITLLIGLLGFYRLDTASNDTMWSLVATGLERTDGVSMNIAHGDPVHSQGTSLIMAASDIGSAAQYFDIHRQDLNMERVSSALAQAAYYMTGDQDPKATAVAKEYIDQSAPIIESGLRNLRFVSDPIALQNVINKMSAIIPSELQQPWQVN